HGPGEPARGARPRAVRLRRARRDRAEARRVAVRREPRKSARATAAARAAAEPDAHASADGARRSLRFSAAWPCGLRVPRLESPMKSVCIFVSILALAACGDNKSKATPDGHGSTDAPTADAQTTPRLIVVAPSADFKTPPGIMSELDLASQRVTKNLAAGV